MKSIAFPFYLLTAAVATALLLPFWLQDGMFLDGVIYATVARNLSEGIGEIWQPMFHCKIEKVFYEQPSFAFFLQSLCFRAFGDSIYVERFYSAITYLIACFSIIYIYKKNIHADKKTLWLPVFFYTITPLVFWSYRHNMLENTMLIFDLWAVFFLVKESEKVGKWESDLESSKVGKWESSVVLSHFPTLLLSLSSFFIFLAVLTKGVVGLFPLGVFFGQWLILKKISFAEMLKKTFFATFLLILYFSVLFYFSPKALYFFQQYIDIQLISSLKGERDLTDDGNHFLLLIRLIQELIPMFLFYGLFKISLFFKNRKTFFTKKIYSEQVIFWLYIGLSASLPMMVSPKQHAYYLVPSMPYFAIAAALLTAHYIAPILDFFNYKKTLIISCIVLTISILYSISFYKKVSRDKAMLHDIRLIKNLLPPCSLIGIDQTFYAEYAVGTFLMRYNHFDAVIDDKTQPFFLSTKENSLNNDGFDEILIGEMKFFRLWKKNSFRR